MALCKPSQGLFVVSFFVVSLFQIRLPDATLDCLWYTYSFSVVLRSLCLDMALSWIGDGAFLARSLPSLWLRRHLARMETTVMCWCRANGGTQRQESCADAGGAMSVSRSVPPVNIVASILGKLCVKELHLLPSRNQTGL